MSSCGNIEAALPLFFSCAFSHLLIILSWRRELLFILRKDRLLMHKSSLCPLASLQAELPAIKDWALSSQYWIWAYKSYCMRGQQINNLTSCPRLRLPVSPADPSAKHMRELIAARRKLHQKVTSANYHFQCKEHNSSSTTLCQHCGSMPCLPVHWLAQSIFPRKPSTLLTHGVCTRMHAGHCQRHLLSVYLVYSASLALYVRVKPDGG